MRGKRAKKRIPDPDPRFGSIKISRFVNYLMMEGKKSVARNIVYGSLDEIAKKLKGEPVALFEQALAIIKPPVEIRAKRVGGANYQVPVPVSEGRQESLAMRWIINAARANRGKRTFIESLAQELINATKKEGDAYKKREDTVRMAEANKAFAHFGA